MNNIGALTAFIKVDVTFDMFNISLSNTDDIAGTGHPVLGYNLFSINDLISNATDGAITDAEQVAEEGAVIMVQSLWYCNFNRDSEGKNCAPDFKIRRIDGQPNSISSGINYRTVTYDITKKKRLLEKLIGIRVIFVIEGRGGKFDLMVLTTTFGAGLAYMGIATLIADIILQYFLPHSKAYDGHKHERIDDEELELQRVQSEEAGQESQALNAQAVV